MVFITTKILPVDIFLPAKRRSSGGALTHVLFNFSHGQNRKFKNEKIHFSVSKNREKTCANIYFVTNYYS